MPFRGLPSGYYLNILGSGITVFNKYIYLLTHVEPDIAIHVTGVVHWFLIYAEDGISNLDAGCRGW
ncbi:unnamed protein product [marine sediment metagenome]|uniref:Uncharacterized protein n=1 Tax=marine sediment metagenome TaxID=412755 RepID=X1NHQ5_9ZZZZ